MLWMSGTEAARAPVSSSCLESAKERTPRMSPPHVISPCADHVKWRSPRIALTTPQIRMTVNSRVTMIVAIIKTANPTERCELSIDGLKNNPSDM